MIKNKNKNVLNYFLLSLVIGLLIFLFGKLICNNGNKTIWTYWDTPDNIPEIVQICIKRMEKYTPGYTVVLLTKTNYKEHVSIPDEIANHKNFNDSHARFSDLIRLSVLAEKGGIWMDASILLNSKLTFDFKKYEFYGYYLQSFTTTMEFPVIESWFLGARKNSEFIRKWRDEFYEMANFESVNEYINSRRKMGIDFQNIDIPDYLAIHIAGQKVLQIDKYPITHFNIKKAEDTAYKYLFYNASTSKEDVGVREEKGFRSIVDIEYEIIKIRGRERGYMNDDPILKEKIINKYKI